MSNKMWGGRFSTAPDAIMEEINASIGFDQRLYAQDIAGSKAHAAMLAAQGIVAAKDAQKITKGLDTILSEIEAGKFSFRRPRLEDIHMNVESRLAELIGAPAGRLHTARSRNDQVATDFRLYVRDTVDALDAQLADLQRALAEKALAHAATVMPGFTHLQTAQPVTFGHHLMAYVEMMARDRSRFADARGAPQRMPAGLGGAGRHLFPHRPRGHRRRARLRPATANSLDAVSDRDFVMETLSAASICAIHLSRFAEEVVIWTSPSFALVKLSDAFTTGSSIMPQKRNPDAAELVRAKAGRIIGALTGILVVMKGLPLAYAKDMQEDKEGAFDAFSALSLVIAATAGMVRDLSPDEKRMATAAGPGLFHRHRPRRLAGPGSEHPVPRGAPHYRPHRALASDRGIALHKVPLEDMQAVDKRITGDVFSVLSVVRSVRSRTSYGGTAAAARARPGAALAEAPRGRPGRDLMPAGWGPRPARGLAFAAARAIVAPTLMPMARTKMRTLATLMALCGTLALAACGVKGPLEPPPGAHAAAPPPKPATATAAADSSSSYTPPKTAAEFNESAVPHASWEKKKTSGSSSSSDKLLKGIDRPDQPLLIDGLL